ncbi:MULTISPECIES: fluoride efflux transporter FluC [unclassified Luteococcus]|uniref:fluoride efflux transporter FluC n=1 Tax=unclassified Luteococcus TaxID=2639923 RepID=UPI00313BAF8E
MTAQPTSHPAVDPDVDHLACARPLHLRPRYLYVVFVGGVLGTLARWSVAEWLPVRDGWPAGTLAANLAGAFCLGLLLEMLLRLAPDEGWLRLARLHFGTGFLGSFTTMSALATQTVLLADSSRAGLALGYLAVSLLGGVLLAWAGMLTGAWLAARRMGAGA